MKHNRILSKFIRYNDDILKPFDKAYLFKIFIVIIWKVVRAWLTEFILDIWNPFRQYFII